jgi:hypothetical protein
VLSQMGLPQTKQFTWKGGRGDADAAASGRD